MSIPIKSFERIYVIFVLFMSIGAFSTIFVNTNAGDVSSPVLNAAWLFIWGVTVIRLIRRRHDIAAALEGSGPLLLLVGFCCISFLWSVDAKASLRAALLLVLTTLIALDFRIRYSLEEFVRLLATIVLAIIIVGVPFDLLLHGVVPNLDLDKTGWNGLLGTKNEWGRVIVLGVALFLSLPIKSKLLKFLCIGAAYPLLWKVRSAGAIVNCTLMVATSIACIPLRWRSKARGLSFIVLPILGCIAIYFALAHVAELTGSLGKDPSLTGRTTLWRLAFASILHRPILGYGYAAFWGHNQQLAYRIREQSNWLDAPHSHNGYIETLLAFGGVGLVLVLFVYIRQLILAIRNAIQDRSSYAIWPVLFTIFFITYQFDEALLIGGNSVFWISFATASLYLGGTRSTEVFYTEGASLSDSTGASRWRSRRDDGPAAQPLA